MLTPVDESGRFYPEYGWLAGPRRPRGRRRHHRRPPSARPPGRRRHDQPPLSGVLALPHAADLPHQRRLVHLGRRDPRADARREPHRRVDARVHGQAHGRLAREHVRLEHLTAPLLRPAAPLLPVLVRAPHRRRLAGAARRAGHRPRSTGSRSCADRGSTTSRSAARQCGEEVQPHRRGRRRVARRRHRPVLHARLGEPRVDRRGLRHRRRQGPHHRRPPRPRLLGGVVPRRLGVGDARADPAVVLLAAVHVGRAHRPGAVPQGARLREDARRAGPGDARLVGQHDRRPRGVRPHGRRRDALAVLRAAAEPEPAVRLRSRPGDPAQAPHALEQRVVLRAVRQHRRLHARRSSCSPTDPATEGLTAARPVDGRRARARWSPRSPTPTTSTSPSTCCGRSRRSSTTSRTGTSAARAAASGTATRPRCARCSARSSTGCARCRRSCRSSPSTSGRCSSPTSCPTPRARCSSPAGPRSRPPTTTCSTRSPPCAGSSSSAARPRAASKMQTRQPLRRLVAEGLDRAAGHTATRSPTSCGSRRSSSARSRPPSCGCAPTSRCSARGWAPSSASCARRSRPASSRPLPDGGFRVAGHDLTADEVLVERTEKEGWAVAAADGATVALDLELDDELRLEGRVYDLIHHVNNLRKEQGLALTDRIDLRLPAARRRPAGARRLDRARDARAERRARRRRRADAHPALSGGRLGGRLGGLLGRRPSWPAPPSWRRCRLLGRAPSWPARGLLGAAAFLAGGLLGRRGRLLGRSLLGRSLLRRGLLGRGAFFAGARLLGRRRPRRRRPSWRRRRGGAGAAAAPGHRAGGRCRRAGCAAAERHLAVAHERELLGVELTEQRPDLRGRQRLVVLDREPVVLVGPRGGRRGGCDAGPARRRGARARRSRISGRPFVAQLPLLHHADLVGVELRQQRQDLADGELVVVGDRELDLLGLLDPSLAVGHAAARSRRASRRGRRRGTGAAAGAGAAPAGRRDRQRRRRRLRSAAACCGAGRRSAPPRRRRCTRSTGR